MTVILANGEFPARGSRARELLLSAERIVACDGAADTFREETGREPDFVVGDMDSMRSRGGAQVVKMEEQETNDLDKAIRFCREKGWRELIIAGATGKREDHMLGNVFRAMAAGVEIVTDHGRFLPFSERLSAAAGKGTPVSVFATDRRTRMSSSGLEWPLDDVKFDNLHCATLNRAAADEIEIITDRPAFAYIAERP